MLCSLGAPCPCSSLFQFNERGKRKEEEKRGVYLVLSCFPYRTITKSGERSKGDQEARGEEKGRRQGKEVGLEVMTDPKLG